MTQAELAQKINISISYMGKIECGALKKGISLPILLAICEELKIEPGTIIVLKNGEEVL